MAVMSMVGASQLDARRLVNSLLTDPVMAEHFRLSREAIADDVIDGKRDWLGDDIGEIGEQYDYHVDGATYRSYMETLLKGRTLDFWQGVYHVTIDDRKAVIVIFDGDVFLDGQVLVDVEFRDRTLTWKAVDVSVREDGTVPEIPTTPYNVTSGVLHFSSPNFTWSASDEFETHLDHDLRLDVRGRLWDQGAKEPAADNVSGNTVPLEVPRKKPLLRAAAVAATPSVQLSTDYNGTYTTLSMDTTGGTPEWTANADLAIDVSTPTSPSVTFGGSDVATTTMFANTSTALLAWNDTTDSGTAAELTFYKNTVTAKGAFKGYLSTSATGIDKTKGRNFTGHLPPDPPPPSEDPVAVDTLNWTIAGSMASAGLTLGGLVAAVVMFMRQRAADKKEKDLDIELHERANVDKEDRKRYSDIVSELKDYGINANRDVQEVLQLRPDFTLPKNKVEFDAAKKEVADLLTNFDAKNASMQTRIDFMDASAKREKLKVEATEGTYNDAVRDLARAPQGSKVDHLQRAVADAKAKLDLAKKRQAAVEKKLKDVREQKTKRENSRREYMLRHNIYKKLDVKNGTFHLIHG